MVTNGAREAFTPHHVLTAMVTMRGGDADKKKAAMDYLGKFQKEVSRRERHFEPPLPCLLLTPDAGRCLDRHDCHPPIFSRTRSDTLRGYHTEGQGIWTRRPGPVMEI